MLSEANQPMIQLSGAFCAPEDALKAPEDRSPPGRCREFEPAAFQGFDYMFVAKGSILAVIIIHVSSPRQIHTKTSIIRYTDEFMAPIEAVSP